MIKFLSSPLLTILFALVMALYLVQGKLFGGNLYPQVMVSLACLLTAQSVLAIIYRFLLLSGKISQQYFSSKKKKGELLNRNLEEASGLLSDMGFSQTIYGNDREDRCRCFMKRMNVPSVLEIAAFGAVVFILISGILNYGFGISGKVNVSPGGEMMDMGKVRLERGVFAERFTPSFKFRSTGLTDTLTERPSTASLEVTDSRSGKITSYNIRVGESITINGIRMQYRGDAYMAYIAIYKGSHDYRPVPVKFESWTGNPEKPYSAPIRIRTPGVRGEGEFDAVFRKLRVKVYRGKAPEFDGELFSGKREYQGDVMVQFTSLVHYGTFDISRYGYRNQVIGGMITLIMFLVMRIIFRPGIVCLWSEGDRVYFYTRERSIKRLLLEG